MRARTVPDQRIAPVDLPTVEPAAVIGADDATWTTDVPPTYELAAAVDPGALRREVFGFLPYWELSDASTTFDWEKLSTIAYFGVGAQANGYLQKRNTDGSTTVGWSGWTSSKMTSVINAAHANRTRVVLTVQSFAWSTSGATRQKALLGSSTARSRLAYQIAAAIRDRGADGVNLDFEPIVSGYADEFTALVRKVRSVLNATARGYQLTFDTTGYIGNYPIEAATASGGADAIFIMGYDYRSSTSSPVGSIAPIGGARYDIRQTLAAYVSRVPASKLILGVPYYGRAWSTATNGLNARNISGSKYGASATVLYETARSYAATYGRSYDPIEGVAWTAYRRDNCTATYGCVTAWRQIYYDDATALRAKYDLVNRYGLRGAGIWALGYDGTRPELYQAIADKFITDTIPPSIRSGSLSAAAFSPNGDGVLDATTARLAVTGLITWGYRIQPVVGGVLGANIRSGSRTGKTPIVTWNGMDAGGQRAPDGQYRITLWAEDASGNHAARAFGVRLDTRPANATSSASIGFITPDGDRKADTLPLRWAAGEALVGAVRLRDAGGATVRAWTFGLRTSWATTWTGRDRNGLVVKDGRYTYRVDGRDRAGNRTVVDRMILVDRTIKSVLWSDGSFDPRAGQRSHASIVLRRAARITVGIYHGNTLVRRIWTARSLAAGTYGWTWNGRDASGAYVAPGTYRILLSATSWVGTTWYARNVSVQVH
jgi:spore germination protein YaaH/flagellar hook assembly protein FlgD